MNIDTDFTQSIVIDNIKCLIQDVNMQFGQFNIRFNHGFEVFNVCCGPISLLMPDLKRRN